MSIEHLILDLDETLYPSSNQLWSRIRTRIDEYLIEYAEISPSCVESERKRLFDTYGTTLRGLALEKDVDLHKYLDYVHDVPVEDLIIKNQNLIMLFESITCDKFVFSNASRKHAERVLDALEIKSFFSKIISIEDLHPWCKPQIEAFQIALNNIGISDYTTCLFVDDSQSNIESARIIGMQTIHVTSEKSSSNADYTITDFCKIKPILQKLNCI